MKNEERAKEIFALPMPSTSIVRLEVGTLEGDFRIQFDYDDGSGSLFREIRFAKVRALRKRAEIYTTPWHINAYDRVLEIENSEWVAELLDANPQPWKNTWVMRHFLVCLDGVGAIEAVAEEALLV